MDLDLLRTFLEVARTRHFARAADNLFVTQAAVSARIRLLETRLGSRVFSRQRNNIQLTRAGHRLLPYAETIIGSWNRAVAEVGTESGHAVIGIGYLPSLGDLFGETLLEALQIRAPKLTVHLAQLTSANLVHAVREQAVDIGLMYEPPHARDLEVEEVVEIELVMVSSRPGTHLDTPPPDYYYVDWGTSFGITHAAQLGAPEQVIAQIDTPGLVHRMLKRRGGSAYLAHHLVAADLARGVLHRVAGAPVLRRAVYALRSSAWADTVELHAALEVMRALGDQGLGSLDNP